MESKRKNPLTATQILVIGMMVVILIGGILLKLPISNQEGKSIKFIDSLFVSTSAVCVTGLTTVVPNEQFSFFGQIVLMLLIEIGGLGLMSFIALILMLMGKKINLSERMIIKESLNQNNMKGLIKLIQRIFLYTITFQTIGAVLLATRFIPIYGLKTGIFYSIFHSVSSFCNAGFDVIGNNSLVPFQYDAIVNITVMGLIIVGGLGFTVWYDVLKSIKNFIKTKSKVSRIWKELTIHTKIVLISTIFLLISGMFVTFMLEKNNIQVMGNDTFAQKMLKSSFYSTTLRTAGYTTVNIDSLSATTKFISMLYMFIGGSPASTAGGIKNVTFSIIILMVLSFIQGKDKTIVFKRKIPFKTIKRAVAIVTISICIVVAAIVLLTVTEKGTPQIEFMDISYEVFSAFGTVGLTVGITSLLSTLGKIIIMLLMFAGRLGPITLSFALFSKYNKKQKSYIKYPKCDLLVG